MKKNKSLTKRMRMKLKMWRALCRRPFIAATCIGITGSSGKSTTTALLGHVLKECGSLTCQVRNNTIEALQSTLRRMPRDQDYCVVEVGIGDKGDMAPMARLLRPQMAIVTMVGLDHYSAFRSREAVAREKGRLVEAVRPGGVVVLNADDEHVMSMASRARARVVTFGHSPASDFRIEATTPPGVGGIGFDIVWKDGRVHLQTRFVANHFAYCCAATFAAALELGMTPEAIAERIAGFDGLNERFRLYAPQGGPRFVIDTVKAPWASMLQTIDSFAAIEAPRKRIVIGQIADYAGAARPKYRGAYNAAREVADQVIFVGENAKRAGASEEDRASGRFVDFPDAAAAARHIRDTASPDELILLKSSTNLHLERIAYMWDQNVRCWEALCGRHQSCTDCGLYDRPFPEHPQSRKARRRERRLRA